MRVLACIFFPQDSPVPAFTAFLKSICTVLEPIRVFNVMLATTANLKTVSDGDWDAWSAKSVVLYTAFMNIRRCTIITLSQPSEFPFSDPQLALSPKLYADRLCRRIRALLPSPDQAPATATITPGVINFGSARNAARFEESTTDSTDQ